MTAWKLYGLTCSCWTVLKTTCCAGYDLKVGASVKPYRRATGHAQHAHLSSRSMLSMAAVETACISSMQCVRKRSWVQARLCIRSAAYCVNKLILKSMGSVHLCCAIASQNSTALYCYASAIEVYTVRVDCAGD
eukprot:19378-Heterococcus_DN1.PRE.1